MKYKILGLIACISVILTSVMIECRPADTTERYHQHLEATEKAACTDHTEDVFCSHLPVVKIETGGVTIPGKRTKNYDRFAENIYTCAEDGESMVKVSVSVFDNETENNHLTDNPTFQTDSLIRIRGHMSRAFKKAPYLLKFIDEQGLEKDIKVMGMDAHNEWALHGPYLDKSLIRNYMFYNLSGEMMEYAPNVRFCELFLDGDYRGIYLMTESIANGDNCRLNLTVTEKGQSVTGYLYRHDRISELDLNTTREINPLSERNGHASNDITIRYPGKNSLTPKLAEEIELEISAFEKSIFSFDYDSNKYGYRTYVDFDNAVDYFIINELSTNTDAGRYSTYVYKKPNEKYRFCVWDFNNSCDNGIEIAFGADGFSMQNKLYFRNFCRDEDFTNAVIERYQELRQSILSDEYINNYMDDTIAYLGKAVDRNSARWNWYMKSNPLTPIERNVHSTAEAVEELRGWLDNRMKWLDENIDSLRQYSADSKVKKYNEVSD